MTHYGHGKSNNGLSETFEFLTLIKNYIFFGKMTVFLGFLWPENPFSIWKNLLAQIIADIHADAS